MLAPLDNETIFKRAFTDKLVFTAFVKDILDIDIEVDKIETEKKFEPKAGHIALSYDIFAQSTDRRVIIEIQRIDYDYNFDRFLHYHMMAIAELQRSSKDYLIERTVYTIVVLTAPYKIEDKSRRPVKDEVLVSSMDPRNLDDKVVSIYGHKLIFLNHHYRGERTPANYRDWLDLFYESTHNPETYHVNLENLGVRRAVELIDYDSLDGETVHLMKINEQRKVVKKMTEDESFKKGKKEGMEQGIEKGMEQGIEKGMETGMEKGVRQTNTEIAVKMKQDGLDLDTIIKYTSLSAEDIEKL